MTKTAWNAVLARVFIQKDGPGNPWLFTDPETDVDGLGGGGRSFASKYAGGQYYGSTLTGNPEDFTGQLTARRYNTASALRDLAESGYPFGMLLASGCDPDPINFDNALYLTDAAFTTRLNTSAKMVDAQARANEKVNDSFPFRAATAQEWRRLSCARYGPASTAIATPYTRVIALNDRYPQHNGISNDGNQEFIAVSNGIFPITVPMIHYTSNGGLTWKAISLSGITSGGPNDVTIIEDSILIAVSGTSAGVWRVNYNTLKDPATTSTITATAASGIAVGGAQSGMRAIKRIGAKVYTCGPNGHVWVSGDNGYSFTQLNQPLSGSELFYIAAHDENTIFFAGQSNTRLLTYKNGSFTMQTLGTAINSSNIRSLAVPPRDSDELYIGTLEGRLWRSRDGRVSFEEVLFDGSGNAGGGLHNLQFAGDNGSLLFWIQHAGGTTETRLLVDRSGGAGGAAVQVIRNYAAPALVSFAMSSPNYGIAVTGSIGGVRYFERIKG
jgi:hypothetical protein